MRSVPVAEPWCGAGTVPEGRGAACWCPGKPGEPCDHYVRMMESQRLPSAEASDK